MVYSPVSKNIEAGSMTIDKPNAIVLTGGAGDRIASAAGADTSENASKPEVGNTALSDAKVSEMQSNLKANPPKPFDITRKMNIFTSRVQYVEFSVSNYQFTTRQIPLPPELVDVADRDVPAPDGVEQGVADGVGGEALGEIGPDQATPVSEAPGPLGCHICREAHTQQIDVMDYPTAVAQPQPSSGKFCVHECGSLADG